MNDDNDHHLKLCMAQSVSESLSFNDCCVDSWNFFDKIIFRKTE